MSKLTVSASPHVRSADTVTGIMGDVIISLIPALVTSVFLYGFNALLIIAVCVISCVGFEYLSRKILKRDNTIGDLSAVVTGILLAFNLPSTIPWWMAVIGSFAAIVIVKQCFGGIGQNFVNPAIAGRIILLVSFSSAMTDWVQPLQWKDTVDAVTTATPLARLSAIDLSGNIASQIAADSELPSLLKMLFGIREGCLGEGCAVALIAGGIYLIARKVIKPVIPLTFIGTVAVIMLIAGKGDLTFVAYELLSGGLLLGAIFMATDYATTPINTKGKIIFGIGCGIITSVIRLFGSLPEGVSYSIILMNILVPHIETLTRPKPFGFVKEKKSKEKEAV